jgi:hypothetical protein
MASATMREDGYDDRCDGAGKGTYVSEKRDRDPGSKDSGPTSARLPLHMRLRCHMSRQLIMGSILAKFHCRRTHCPLCERKCA